MDLEKGRRREEEQPIIIEKSRSDKAHGKAPVFVPPASYNLIKETQMGEAAKRKRGIAIFDFVIRLIAATTAMAAAVKMGTTEQTLPFFTQFLQFHAEYTDLPTFSFFVIANSIVGGYLVLSLPFSIVCIVRPLAVPPRLLLIILDTVMVSLTIAGAAASAAIVYVAHEGASDANWLPVCQQFGDFCQASSTAVVASFIAAVLLVFLVVLSAIALKGTN